MGAFYRSFESWVVSYELRLTRVSRPRDGDELRALPERHLAELGEVVATRHDRQEMIASELTGFACKVRVAVGNEHFGLADPARVEKDLPRPGIGRRVFRSQTQLESAKRHPHGLAAPSDVDRVFREREQRPKGRAGPRR